MTGYVHVCAACGTRLEVPERYLGRAVRCSSCGARFVAGLTEANSPEVPAEPPATERDNGAFTARCAGCGRQLRIRERHLGQRLKCPACGAVFLATRDLSAPPGGDQLDTSPGESETRPRVPSDPTPKTGSEAVAGDRAAPPDNGSDQPALGAAEIAGEGVGYTHVCTACGSQMQVHARYLGRTLRCTTCRTEFVARARPWTGLPPPEATTSAAPVRRGTPPRGRSRRARWVVASVVLLAGLAAALWWLGSDRRQGFAGELFTVRKARGELGVLRRSDGGAIIAALDRETLGQLVAALARGDDAAAREISVSPRCLELSTGTRVRLLERRKRAVEARVRILDGPWSSRIVWVHIDWIR